MQWGLVTCFMGAVDLGPMFKTQVGKHIYITIHLSRLLFPQIYRCYRPTLTGTQLIVPYKTDTS